MTDANSNPEMRGSPKHIPEKWSIQANIPHLCVGCLKRNLPQKDIVLLRLLSLETASKRVELEKV
jgi:hypothetical protein